MKDFKTIDEQINILKNKSLVFNDEEDAKKKLLINNYYNVINGYKDLFLDSDGNFIKNTTFEEIFALYEFDRKLRSIFLEYILKIENSLRTLVSYNFSLFHGSDNYLRIENFDNYDKINVSNIKKTKRIKHIQSLIIGINKQLGVSIETKKYIQHYLLTYGYVPLWVLVNILSFGDICNFFKLMKQKERVIVSSNFNIKENDLSSLLGILVKTRNICAHDERLYNIIFDTGMTINDTVYHKNLQIPIINSRYKYGKNDLFAVVIALKMLLSKEDYNSFHDKVVISIMELCSNLTTVELSDVLIYMHFPYNFYDLKNMS